MDTRNHSAIKNVASELQDVQKIMGSKHSWKFFLHMKLFLVANLDEVLQRGTGLDVIQNKSNNLLAYSQQYRDDAKKLNMSSKYV